MTLTEYQDLKDKVGEWHKGDSPCSLREYLGLTQEQMSAFLSGKVDGVPMVKTTFGPMKYCYWKELCDGYRKGCDNTIFSTKGERDLRPFFCPSCGGKIEVVN